jgi:hypothetical protein
MGFGMMGHQMMYRDMMGPGGFGGRDCPGSGYRYGHGMRSDMMGPGMGPGMMNRDDTRIAPAEKKDRASEEN